MTICLLGLGANLGNRAQTLHSAVEMLSDHPRIEVIAASRLIETEPVGGPAGQPPFLNGAVRLESALSATQLHEHICLIEKKLGRQRHRRWAARTVDLDLLLYGDDVISMDQLTVPHPRMAVRRFVLQPAAEIAGAMPHPVFGWSVGQLLEHLDSSLAYIAIAGPPGAGKSALAADLAHKLSARVITEPMAAVTADVLTRGDPRVSELSPQAWQREIELLDVRRARLALARWPDARQFAVSDFWFDQSLAYARLNLPDESRRAFEDYWRAQRRHVAAARLTVLLARPLRPSTQQYAKRVDDLHGGVETDSTARICAALSTLAGQPGRGPILILPNDNRRQTLDEVLAAVQSMR